MIIKSVQPNLWTQTATRAAEEAKRLRPIAQGLFYVALLLIASEYFIQPAWAALAKAPESDFFGAINQLLIYWINAAAAVSLAWALWEAQRYLGKLEETGGVWSVLTMQFIGRIGECLLLSAVWATLLTPSINRWVSYGGGFSWRLESSSVVLFGLGLLMAVIARVFGQVLETAAELKTDNNGII